MNAHTETRTPEFNPAMQADEVLTPFDVTGSSQSAGILKLALGFLILFALAFVVFKIYNPAGTRDRSDPPLITAENTPFKVVPEDPGGAQTPDQDKDVFEIMSGNAPSDDIVIMPPPEQAVSRPEPVVSDAANSDVVETDPQPVRETIAPSETVTPPAPQPVRNTVTPNVPTGNSDWIVQVASLRTQDEAQRTYTSIASRHGGIIGNFRSDIVRVDLAEKGIYYRARVAGFTDRNQAVATCDRLKAAGQSCFVARR